MHYTWERMERGDDSECDLGDRPRIVPVNMEQELGDIQGQILERERRSRGFGCGDLVSAILQND